MQEPLSDKKRIAKNVLLLYARTLLVMLISLYTSRVILDVLRIENYGIYNIVGGFVTLFGVVSATLTATTQRYLTFELGKPQSDSGKIFSAAMTIHAVLVTILFILFETLGLWFLNTKLNISPDKIEAANWVFQCSVFTFLLNIICSPYLATIIAHEKMGIFAYIGLIDVSLKLAIAYILFLPISEKLILYAVLLLIGAAIIQFIYALYCHINFKETKFALTKDKKLYKEMMGFAGMNFIGAFSAILSDQGVNVILNLFFGVTINAARGIVAQVQAALLKFVNDFMIALNPQITKNYAANDKKSSIELACIGAKFSFFLVLILAIPLLFRTHYILEVWLKIFPEASVSFIRLTIIFSLISVLSNPLITIILATGKLKANTLWIGGVRLFILPICFVVLHLGATPDSVYYVIITMEIILLFIRLAIVRALTGIPISIFIYEVLFRIIPVAILSILCALYFETRIESTFIGLILFSIATLLFSCATIFIIGINRDERSKILSYITSKLIRL